ncbi:XK-related protein 4-like [Coccinella septempunctata]|uniref:XK-related protein 4-like n=1 Tax=Coccinella septempunctata TaxID=41139 RepID=UPI001D086462|nr:XK-related protein 4-like [Coccinella septempunctata]
MSENFTVVRFSRDSSLAKIESLKYCETPDKVCENVHNFGIFHVICIALSIITYFVDLILAVLLLYYFSIHQYGTYFAITLTFTLVPAMLMTTVSLRWYIIDHDDPAVGRTSVTNWIVRIVVLLLQLAPLLRYVDTLIFGLRSKIAGSTSSYTEQMTYYRKMLDEDTNSALLRLFHCFLHAAPQALIQLVILLKEEVTHPGKKPFPEDIAILQLWTVMMALISIAWALTSYHRSVRYSRDDKNKLKFSASLIAFCWHLMSAMSRVLALGLLASIFPVWMGCICAFHWGIMSFWLAIGHHQSSCSSRCEELILSVALGLAYVLAFISPKDGPTRYLYLAYYLVCFMENTGALIVWCVANNANDRPLIYYGAAGTQMFTFFLGIIFLLIYYSKFHPTVINRKKLPDVNFGKPGYSKSYNMRRSSS